MNPIKETLQKELRDAGWHSRGYLPHFDGGQIAQTINLHLADSLPQKVVERWELELVANPSKHKDSIIRRRIDRYLDQGFGRCDLKNEPVAAMVQRALLHFDGQRYWLSAWVVMPNHVHVLLTPDNRWSLSRIMKDLKSFTSHEANKLLGRCGQFWMEDYFDRYVRDEKHFTSAIAYIENNPVKARLVKDACDWRFSSAWFASATEVFALRAHLRTRRPRSQHQLESSDPKAPFADRQPCSHTSATCKVTTSTPAYSPLCLIRSEVRTDVQ